VPMSHLHDVYLAAYRLAAHLFGEGIAVTEAELARRVGALAPRERMIAALALHDATNGTPPRRPGAFRRALIDGSRVLELVEGLADRLPEDRLGA